MHFLVADASLGTQILLVAAGLAGSLITLILSQAWQGHTARVAQRWRELESKCNRLATAYENILYPFGLSRSSLGSHLADMAGTEPTDAQWDELFVALNRATIRLLFESGSQSILDNALELQDILGQLGSESTRNELVTLHSRLTALQERLQDQMINHILNLRAQLMAEGAIRRLRRRIIRPVSSPQP